MSDAKQQRSMPRNCPSLGQSGGKIVQALEDVETGLSKDWTIQAAPKKGSAKVSRSGFTLIEVLLAIAILGLCATGLLVSVSRCLAVASKARLYDTARNLIARVELEQPLLLEEEIEEGTEEGDFEGGPEGYRWRREIELAQAGMDSGGLFEEQEDLFKITTRVIWEQRGQEAFEEVVTYLYRPDQGEDSF